MAKQLPIVDTNTDTFFSWIVKTNNLVNLCNTEVVTANNSANGAVTSGRGYVIGTFGANTISCDVLRGGNTIANAALTVSSNTTFTAPRVIINGSVEVGANSSLKIEGLLATTNTVGTQNLDSFSRDTHSTAKYVIAAVNTNNGDRQSTEIMLMHAANTIYKTEYATVFSNTQFCSFTATTNATSVILTSTATSNAVTYNIHRTLVV
jgi:hypothetical protein